MRQHISNALAYLENPHERIYIDAYLLYGRYATGAFFRARAPFPAGEPPAREYRFPKYPYSEKHLTNRFSHAILKIPKVKALAPSVGNAVRFPSRGPSKNARRKRGHALLFALFSFRPMSHPLSRLHLRYQNRILLPQFIYLEF